MLHPTRMSDWFLIPALCCSIVDFDAVVSKWHSNFWQAEMVLQIFTRTQFTRERGTRPVFRKVSKSWSLVGPIRDAGSVEITD